MCSLCESLGLCQWCGGPVPNHYEWCRFVTEPEHPDAVYDERRAMCRYRRDAR